MKIMLKGLVDEDFLQYKKASMFVIFPYCTFKCGAELCQNSALAKAQCFEIDAEDIVRRYIANPITEAIVFGGLDPIDTWEECLALVQTFRNYTKDDIVIYTGYNEDEISDKIAMLTQYSNIIIKYGRFIPNQHAHYDSVLGIELASDNQYGVRYNE